MTEQFDLKICKYCKNCNNPIDIYWKYCAFCGKEQKQEEE